MTKKSIPYILVSIAWFAMLSCSVNTAGSENGAQASSVRSTNSPVDTSAENYGVGYRFDKKWTVMIYMDGDNSLETELLNDLNEMEMIDFNGRGADVIVLADRIGGGAAGDGDWKGSRLYHMCHDTNQKKVGSTRLEDPVYLHITTNGDHEELDMGNPDTLSKFIDFCKTNYPADYSSLILWDHGDGWRSGGNAIRAPSRQRAICVDETSGSILSMGDVENALKAKNVTLLGFDACLMSMAEVAYQLYDPVPDHGYPRFMVASEGNEPSSGWKYNQLFLNFLTNPVRSPENLGRAIIDSFYTTNSDYSGLTLSLLDLSKMGDLASALDVFSAGLMAASADDICVARANAQSFNWHNVDLYDFSRRLPEVSGAGVLSNALDSVVLYQQNSPEVLAHGLSIYFPLDSSLDTNYAQYQKVIRFSGDTQWDEFLEDYYHREHRYVIETFSNQGSRRTDTYLSLFTEDLYPLASNDDVDAENFNLFSKISFPVARGKSYYVLCRSATYKNLGAYSIQFSSAGNGTSEGNPVTGAYETNNDYENATFLPFEAVQDHLLEDYGDDDWFKITVP